MDKDIDKSGTLSIEGLLGEAVNGRSKFAAHSIDIDVLINGGVSLRRVVDWLHSNNVKASHGELSGWLNRRAKRNRAAPETSTSNIQPPISDPPKPGPQPRKAWERSAGDKKSSDDLYEAALKAAKQIDTEAWRKRIEKAKPQ